MVWLHDHRALHGGSWDHSGPHHTLSLSLFFVRDPGVTHLTQDIKQMHTNRCLADARAPRAAYLRACTFVQTGSAGLTNLAALKVYS